MDPSLSKLCELVRSGKPDVLQSMGCKESDMTECSNSSNVSDNSVISSVHIFFISFEIFLVFGMTIHFY